MNLKVKRRYHLLQPLESIIADIHNELDDHEYEGGAHVLDCEGAREADLIEIGVQSLVIPVWTGEGLLIDQLRRQDVQLREADDITVQLLGGPRDRDRDQGEDRKRREGVEEAPEI